MKALLVMVSGPEMVAVQWQWLEWEPGLRSLAEGQVLRGVALDSVVCQVLMKERELAS